MTASMRFTRSEMENLDGGLLDIARTVHDYFGLRDDDVQEIILRFTTNGHGQTKKAYSVYWVPDDGHFRRGDWVINVTEPEPDVVRGPRQARTRKPKPTTEEQS